MYNMICSATKEVLKAHPEFSLFMNNMDAVQNARTSYIGDNMTRDGWHLDYTTGRHTVGCLWYEKIFEDRTIIEEEVCRWHMTDEKTDIDRKDSLR